MKYTVQSQQQRPHEKLQATVLKHVSTMWKKQISPLQRMQFAKVDQIIQKKPQAIILDSCCGTGRSTEQLAKKFPNHWVVGLDKSEVRLAKNPVWRDGMVHDNMILLRADVIDFWQQVVTAAWPVSQHYILYPNPYPKKSQLTKRWYGHAIFPVLLKTAPVFEVRSNWRMYIDEWQLATETLYPRADVVVCELAQQNVALTAFEKKYLQAGEGCFQLNAQLNGGLVLS